MTFGPSGNPIPPISHSKCLIVSVSPICASVQRCTHARDLGASETVPQNGEINDGFGAYKSVCCGSEIIITKGAIFPNCPNHPRYTTIWKLHSDENTIRLTGKKKSELKPVA